MISKKNVKRWFGRQQRLLLHPFFPKANRFPVELSADERGFIQSIYDQEISMSKMESLFATALACKYVNGANIEGDFVECGVWRGGHSIIAAKILSGGASGRKIYLYDTFSGMVEPTEYDVNERGEAAIHKFNQKRREDGNDWCYASLDEVKKNFEAYRQLDSRINFVKGDVSETLSKNSNLPGKISILRLDTDWYEPTKVELEILYPRLQPGGVIILDDYGNWGGERKAVDEYFSKKQRPFFHYIHFASRIGVKP